MKLFFIGLFLLSIVSLANASQEQKLEGRCSGPLEDGTQVEFSYYSDFDGCQGNIASSIKFSKESGLGYHVGSRTFENHKDIYSFKGEKTNTPQEVYRLTFEDSTGNVTGVLDYFDLQGAKQSITIQCEILDFEYEDCPI